VTVAVDVNQSEGILRGVRVLDFGRYVAGPFCAALLGDFGADVIRIDRVGGSEDRSIMPVSAEGAGALFLQSNRNKRSVTLNVSSAEGRKIVAKLVLTADVVVVNMPPQTLIGLGLDYPTLAAIRPDIIVTSVSAFGDRGPYRNQPGFDGIGQAMSGAVHLAGPPGLPCKAMVQTVDFATAITAAMGTLAALYERKMTGRGQCVQASLLHTALNLASGPLLEESAIGLGRKSTGNRSPIIGPSDIFRVRDGWIILQVVGQAQFKRWVRLVGRPELLDDPRFRDDPARGENGAELSAIMSAWCADRTTAEILAVLEQAKIPAGPVYSLQQALEDEHVRAAGFLTPVDYPGLSRPTQMVTPPAQLSLTPATIRSRAPLTGEHTDSVLLQLGYSMQEIATLRQGNVI
jgi:crotonobetainyl-CoA:carnitine CoA-transferase CaiB-like acyl-CoA transferase